MSTGRRKVLLPGLLVSGLLAAGCGNPASEPGARPGSRSATSTTSAGSYVGLSKRDAIARAEAEGRPWRIVREDDEYFPVTQDYVEQRVNFEIDDGTVTTATFG